MPLANPIFFNTLKIKTEKNRPIIEPTVQYLDGFHSLTTTNSYRYKATVMLLQILKSKIHRATVTDANVDYEGSITLDEDLMTAAGFIPHEMVHIWDVTTGDRLYTYVMPPAPKGSGTVCLNGSAALRIKKDHIIIITSFVNLTPDEVAIHQPNKILVDKKNKIVQIKHE